MTLIIILRVQAASAAASASVERGEASGRAEEAAAETQRSLLRAEMYAALTREELGGETIVEWLRRLGREPGQEPHESWIQRGGFSSEDILADIQSRREMTHSQLELLSTCQLTS